MKNQTPTNAEAPVASKAENATGQMEPTPRPWEVQSLNHADGELWLQIGHNGYGPIAGISGDEVREPYFKPVAGMKYLATSEAEQRANAELICRCVNNHEALLEALKALVKMYVANLGSDCEFISCITPRHASDMTPKQRRTDNVWSAFDAARAAIAAAEKE